MKKQVKLKAQETAATNRDFYNLFRPIAPSIDVIGKVAQVISGLTEAITIWHITQSEMAGSSKALSILVSILATLLLVAILELGGRKFLQVLTRALVWKRLKNAWYVGLFAIVACITIGIGVLSFRLSTNGIHHAFVSKVPVTTNVDDSRIRLDYKDNVKDLSSNFDQELNLMKENHQEILNSTSEKYNSKISSLNLKASQYEDRYKKGASWAKGHVEKYHKEASYLETKKAEAIVALNEAHTKKTDSWLARKSKALDKEKVTLSSAITSAEKSLEKVNQSKFKNAEFWGGLFSFLVGFSVILAFVCIITVEVYRRGCGIQVEYQEEDAEPSIIELIWMGFQSRTGNFFRQRAEKFAQVNPSTTIASRSIGFNQSTPLVSAQSEVNIHSDVSDSYDDID